MLEVVIFERRIFVHLRRNGGTHEQPDTRDFEVGFFTVDRVGTESDLSSGVTSLEEIVLHVVEEIEDLTITSVLLVV